MNNVKKNKEKQVVNLMEKVIFDGNKISWKKYLSTI